MALGNPMEMQQDLKLLKDEQLAAQLQDPQSPTPAFLVLAELKRRKDVRAGTQQAPQGPSMRDEMLAPSGPPAGMARGGIVGLQAGGQPPGQYNSDPNAIFTGEGWRKIGSSIYPIAQSAFPMLGADTAEKWRQAHSQAPTLGSGAYAFNAPGAPAAPVAPTPTRGVTSEGEEKTVPPVSGGGGGGGGGLTNVGLTPYAPQSQDDYIKALGAFPTQKVLSLGDTADEAARLQKQYGQDFEPQRQEQANRRTELEQLKGENRNTALLQAGLGIMGGSSTNAFENIGKGAAQGVDYLSKAKDAERRELQAIRDGDFKLAQAAHQEKITWINTAHQLGQKGEEAKHAGAVGQYKTRETALGLSRDDQKIVAEQERAQMELRLAAERNAIARIAANRPLGGAGGGVNMKMDPKFMREQYTANIAEQNRIIQAGNERKLKSPAEIEEFRRLSTMDPKAREQEAADKTTQMAQRLGLMYDAKNANTWQGIGGQSEYVDLP